MAALHASTEVFFFRDFNPTQPNLKPDWKARPCLISLCVCVWDILFPAAKVRAIDVLQISQWFGLVGVLSMSNSKTAHRHKSSPMRWIIYYSRVCTTTEPQATASSAVQEKPRPVKVDHRSISRHSSTAVPGLDLLSWKSGVNLKVPCHCALPTPLCAVLSLMERGGGPLSFLSLPLSCLAYTWEGAKRAKLDLDRIIFRINTHVRGYVQVASGFYCRHIYC